MEIKYCNNNNITHSKCKIVKVEESLKLNISLENRLSTSYGAMCDITIQFFIRKMLKYIFV